MVLLYVHHSLIKRKKRIFITCEISPNHKLKQPFRKSVYYYNRVNISTGVHEKQDNKTRGQNCGTKR